MRLFQVTRAPRNRLDTMVGWYAQIRPWLLGLLGLVWMGLAVLEETASPLRFWPMVAAVLSGILVATRVFFPGTGLVLAWIIAVAQMLPPGKVLFYPTLAIVMTVSSAAHFGNRLVRRFGALSVPVGSLVASTYLYNTDDYGLVLVAPPKTSFVFFFIIVFVVLGFAWAIGTLGAIRDRYAHRNAEMAVAQHEVAAQKERADLARDMHDVLAHSLSVIISLADGVRLANPDLPESALSPLRSISLVGRDSLSEVRGLLARLRSSGDSASQELNTIEAIIEAFRTAGLQVVTQEKGTKPDAATPMYKTVTHLMREALTNALRHGNNAEPVFLIFDWGDPSRGIPVRFEAKNSLQAHTAHSPHTPRSIFLSSQTNSERSQSSVGQHWGLIGMKERVSLLNGTISCGTIGQNWVVSVTLPSGGLSY